MRQIKRITTFAECDGFVRGFFGDKQYSDPMLYGEDNLDSMLINPINTPERHLVMGIYDNDRMTGLFSFMRLADERYLEMLAGLSRDEESYTVMLDFLREHCKSYAADFVFNPNNRLMSELLEKSGAEFDTEQQKMVFDGREIDFDSPVEMEQSGIVELSEKYVPSYLKIHATDVYWTGEKVIEASHRFRVFVAVEDGEAVGYIDMTKSYDENEIFDLYVLENHRRCGYGRGLLAKALVENKPNDMMLLVDVDNTPALRLYDSMGFSVVPGRNYITAHTVL